jgi:hypothetical protein
MQSRDSSVYVVVAVEWMWENRNSIPVRGKRFSHLYDIQACPGASIRVEGADKMTSTFIWSYDVSSSFASMV